MELHEVSSICENAFKDYIENYKQEYRQCLDDYSIPENTNDLNQLLKDIEYLSRALDRLKSHEPRPCDYDIKPIIDTKLNAVREDLQVKERTIMREYEEAVDAKKRAAATAYREAVDAEESKVNTLKEKHAKLVDYKGKLSLTFETYNILPNDVTISEDITYDEMLLLLDNSIALCESYFRNENNSIVKTLNLDPQNMTESEGWGLLIAVFFGLLLASPVLLGVYSFKTFTATKRIYQKLEELKVASSLMYDMDFDRFLYKPSDEMLEVDTTEDETMRDVALSQLDNIEDIEDMVHEYYTQKVVEINDIVNSTYSEMKHKWSNSMRVVEDSLNNCKSLLDSLKAAAKPFGTEISDSIVFNYNCVIGTIEGVLNVTEELPKKNIIFNTKKANLIDYIKILLCNFLLNVKEKHLYTTIVDNKTFGTDFSEFLHDEIKEYIITHTLDVSKVITEIQEEMTRRIRLIKTSNIDDYNTECEASGKVPLDYKLYIIIYADKDLEASDDFFHLMSQSARTGLFIWYIGAPSPKMPSDCDYYLVDKLPRLEHGLLEYNRELYTRVLNTYITACKNSEDKGLDYQSKFADKYIPKEKWWTFSTAKGIDLHFGLENGDPDEGWGQPLGDAPVHGLVVGATGAGKSAFLNQMLASLITMYSPQELMLVMVDFKNVEFSFYADEETHTLSRLPHAKVLAGTKDGEYAVSIFDFLCKEMDRRTAIFSQHNVKKLEEYREKYPDAEPMPRILVVIDEFQVMFTEVDTKIVNVITARIRSLAKLARFCGCHMLFTSQSMKGTMEKDILDQFSLRCALRCAADTATQILGDDAPSKIKSKFGYMYSNDNAGQRKDENHLWRVPYIPTSRLNEIISELNVRYGKPISTEFFDEGRLHYEEDLVHWYEKYDQFKDGHIVILGEQTSFSTNKAPKNIEFQKDDGENLMVFGLNRNDTLNIIMTFVNNFRHSDISGYMICSADKDSVEILDVPSIVGPQLAQFAYPSYGFEKLITAWEAMINARKSANSDDIKPFYIICMFYDKQTGYGRNVNNNLSSRFATVMQEAPMYDIHFIITYRTKGDLMGSEFKKFNHKIVLKCDSSMAFQLLESDKPSKFPDNPDDGVFGLYKGTNDEFKFKVYQHKFAKDVTRREIVIE